MDAIRLDTLKHMERGDVLTYVNNWKARKPGLFVFGENLVKGTGFGSEITNDNASAVIRPWWYTRLTTDPANPNGGGDSGLSVLDFSLFSTFRDNIRNGSFGGIGGVLGFDGLYRAWTSAVPPPVFRDFWATTRAALGRSRRCSIAGEIEGARVSFERAATRPSKPSRGWRGQEASEGSEHGRQP